MESYELDLRNFKTINPVNGQFYPGHIPFNKGKKWNDYLDMRKAKRIKKYLELGRVKGNRDKLAAFNRKQIVGIKDGKLISFSCAINAEKALRANGIKINRRNICAVCHGKAVIVQKKYNCIRKKAGGYSWYFADDTEKYKDLLK